MTKLLAHLSAFLLAGAALSMSDADANAAGPGITLAEVTPPPPSSGVDRATLRDVAQGEIARIDSSGARRHVLVSVALVRADESPVACTVDAILRDAKTGNMIAILEGRARAEGSTSRELKRQVAHAAVRSAVRQIPEALSAK